MDNGVRSLALTGTIGAGKTTLAEAISEELHERGVRHALIDLDWLGQVYPVPGGHDPYGYELALQNLKEIWPNFLAAGAERAVIAGTLLSRSHREGIQAALGGAHLTIALVTAPTEVLKARIHSRNSGRLRDDFLARTAIVAEEIRSAGIHDFEVENDGREPRGLVVETLRALRWLPSSDSLT